MSFILFDLLLNRFHEALAYWVEKMIKVTPVQRQASGQGSVTTQGSKKIRVTITDGDGKVIQSFVGDRKEIMAAYESAHRGSGYRY